METKENKKNWILSGVILVLFVITQYMLRTKMFIYSDDVVAQERMLSMNHQEYIKYMFTSVNGKWFTDPLGAFMGQWPFEMWMAVDVVLYTMGVWLAAYIVSAASKTLMGGSNKTLKTEAFYLGCLLIMCFPVSYLLSAGFILTNSNYVYTCIGSLMCLAAVVYLTENAGRKSWVKIIAALGGILGVLYASNQEQSACVLGGMLCGYIFWYFMTHDKKVNIPAVLFLAEDVAGLALLMLAPGHRIRSGSVGGTFSVPGYENWTAANKITEGITATAANIYFQPVQVFMILCVLLFIAAIVMQGKKLKALIPATALVLFQIFEMCTDYEFFIMYHDFSWGLPDTDGSMVSFAVLIVITLLVVAAVWNIFDDKWEAAGILWTLFIGAMSRIMMGFSATLFGSSFRTFMYQLVLIGCVDLYILIRILGRIGNKAVKTGILAALTVIACISYYNNYQWLISYYQWLMTRR